ncbi:MAG: class I SAM-dependent methyltransferase [Spirochaetes bacterium]|nr:class I SAM-dependent methyltransferase [Spirochaetota bacterium]
MKEEEIRPADLFNKYLELSARDASLCFNSSKFKKINCPACNNSKVHEVFEKWGFQFVECDNCHSVFQSPRPLQKDFEKFYQNSQSTKYWTEVFFPAVLEKRRIKLFKPKAKEIVALCKNNGFFPKTIADIGAGFGLLLEELNKDFNHHPELIAVEPNPKMADICRKKGFTVAPVFAEDADKMISNLDLVISLEVLEHVYDPLFFCTSLNKLIKPNGKVLITTLTISGFDIQVLWEKSKSISPPHHINFLSIEGFEILLKNAGFKNINIFTPGKLDVDIVKNYISENPAYISENHFIKTLLSKNEKVLNNFQIFLSENQLSSHCWIWAEK